MLAGKDRLGLDQFLIEAVEREPGREDRVLHVEEAVVERGQAPGLGQPGQPNLITRTALAPLTGPVQLQGLPTAAAEFRRAERP